MTEKETPLYPPGTLQEFFDDDPSKWGRHAYAVNSNGNAVGPSSTSAVRWCLAGAIEKVYGLDTSEMWKCRQKVNAYTEARWGRGITSWNDNSATFEDVKALVKFLNI